MTPEAQFIYNGQQALTRLVAAAHDLEIWAAAFTRRGGQPVFGDDAALIANLSNDLNGVGVEGFLDSGRRALIARLRTDV